MEVKLLSPDKETTQRMLNGCSHYGLKAKFTKKTNPYVHVSVETEEDVVNIFFLGANLSHPKVETSITKSSF